ncbi:MAG: hypothetical protein GY823_05135, partial [Flavobacteriaceae bacterium]|nr:hypothetical protein [Flavobacteriaceae bacterium]
TSEERDNYIADAPIKMKVGLDANGYMGISYWDVSESAWQQIQRSSFAVQDGQEFKLGVKIYGTRGRLHTQPKIHLLEPAAPVMYFRYVESPDGYYSYPLFATEAEADYYELTEAGVDNGSHTHVYPDDPTNTTWYMPNTAHSMDHGISPVGQGMTFDGNAINWTEITSLTNADLAPSAYSAYDLTVNEGEAVVHQTQPMDTWYTTTFANLPAGLVDLGAGMIGGNAPEVSGDNVANPSDSYVVDVIRTNSYGSSTGQLTLIVNNLTPPATLPDGLTQTHGGLNGDGTLAAGGVVTLDDTLASGKRLIVPKTWVEANVLPYVSGSLEKAYVGVPSASANWSNAPDLHIDFDAVMRWEGQSGNAHKSTMADGSDTVARSENSVGSTTNAYYHYAIQWDGTDLVVMADTDLSKLNNEHDYTQMSRYSAYESYSEQSGALPIVLATKQGGSMDLDLTGLSFVDVPDAPVNILTPWTKALDFSGSSERCQQVSSSSSYNPVMMGSQSVTVSAPAAGKTTVAGNSHPWATAVVFKTDRHSSNQHIWNVGEGAGGNDDNIYCRLDASGNLYFGWGRDGALNECKIYDITYSQTNDWFGLYVASNGTRLSGSDATAANLAAAFDIRLMTSDNGDNFSTVGSNLSTVANWSAGSTGGRMDRSVLGATTVGGRGSNRSFHGKVASMVITTLRRNQNMPTDNEITKMITDPVKWVQNFKVGKQYRIPYSSGEFTFSRNESAPAYA